MVSFVDSGGIRHSVEVAAESLYDVGGKPHRSLLNLHNAHSKEYFVL